MNSIYINIIYDYSRSYSIKLDIIKITDRLIKHIHNNKYRSLVKYHYTKKQIQIISLVLTTINRLENMGK